MLCQELRSTLPLYAGRRSLCCRNRGPGRSHMLGHDHSSHHQLLFRYEPALSRLAASSTKRTRPRSTPSGKKSESIGRASTRRLGPQLSEALSVLGVTADRASRPPQPREPPDQTRPLDRPEGRKCRTRRV